MKLRAAPSGRLEKTSVVTVNKVTTKEYVNHQTGQIFRYVIDHKSGDKTWFLDINPLNRASVIPPPDRSERPERKPSRPKEKLVEKEKTKQRFQPKKQA